MPAVKCPIPGCGFVTDDLESSVVAALLNVHSNVHSAGGNGHSLERVKEIEEQMQNIRAKYFSKQPPDFQQQEQSVSFAKRKRKSEQDKEMTVKIACKVRSMSGTRRLSNKEKGGVHEIRLKKHESTYAYIKSEAEKHFKGNVEPGLGDSQTTLELNGKEIDRFIKKNGQECTFAEYLKENNMFSSRCKLYMLCKSSVAQTSNSNEQISQQETLDLCDTMNFNDADGIDTILSKGQVCMSFRKEQENSSITVHGKVGVVEKESAVSPDILGKDACDVNPLDYGYKLTKLIKFEGNNTEKKCFLDWQPSKSGEKCEYIYPLATCNGDNSFILHGPDEINGYEIMDFLLGIILCDQSEAHKVLVKWIRDGCVYRSGEGLFLIYVTEPGLYYAKVFKDDKTYTSKIVCVVKSEAGELKIGHVLDALKCSSDKSPEFQKENTSVKLIEQGKVPCIHSHDFEIGTEIGQGSFGVVYRGKWLGTDVAIKKLSLGKKQKEAQMKAIKKEVGILSSLRHPNLVQIMAFSVESFKAFILMEYVNGNNLESIIFPDEQLPTPCITLNASDKLSAALQIAQGLSYLHGQTVPVIHQDIKPANILVALNKIVKICDLGIARLRTMQTQVCKSLSLTKGFAGTPVYMSPECVLGQNKTTAASDIWSYGCSVIEMYTGKDIWNLDDGGDDDNDDSDSEGTKILEENMKKGLQPHGLSYLQGGTEIPDAVIEVVKKCLMYDLTKRPSAIDIVVKLQHLQENCSRCCKSSVHT